MTQDSLPEQDGQIAYNAYGDHASWKTFDGRDMPRWDELGPVVRSHWIAAAARVARRTLASVSRETSMEEVPDGA